MYDGRAVGTAGDVPTGSPTGAGAGGMQTKRGAERFLSSQADPSQERREGRNRPAPFEMTGEGAG